MALSSNNNPNILNQQIELAINTRENGARGGVIPILPYDPRSAPDDDADTQVLAPNSIDNSDFDWSKDGYLNLPLVGGDVSHECYNFYRHRFIQLNNVATTAASASVASASAVFLAAYTYPMDFVLLNGKASGAALSGTLTRVDDTNATLSVAAETTLENATLWFGTPLAETAAQAVKGDLHSLFPTETANAEIPRWDKTNGWLEFGTATGDYFDIAAPLPINLVRAGLRFYFRCIISLRSGATTNLPVRMSVGIFDATAGQTRFLESTNFKLTVAAVGTSGATTYKYRVIADLDNGRTIESDEITIATGNAILSAANYNRLTWTNASGVLNFRIYRETGGVVKRVFTIRNGAHDYNDYGTDEGETPASIPRASERRPIAYALSPAFNPTSAGVWQNVLIPLDIPSTYDASATTGKQWVRVALEGLSGSARMVLIDRVSLSTSNGGWQRSARDLNKILNQNPSSLPTSSTQGNTGIGNCFTLDTPIIVCERDGAQMRKISIGDAEKGMYVFSGGTRINRIKDTKDGVSSAIIHCVMSNGTEFSCSPSERFITSRADRKGTRIDELTYGDEILCWSEGRTARETIETYVTDPTPVKVRTLSLLGGKTFVAGTSAVLGGVIAHNSKPSGIEQ